MLDNNRLKPRHKNHKKSARELIMFLFEPANYGPLVANLLSEDRRCEVGPGRPNKAALPLLEKLSAESIFESVSDPDMADCCVAGLWLWHDFLDRSHDYSQQIGSPSGSYWHAIMHRREPDYSNSKYWYRRVGHHPIFEPLQEQIVELADQMENEPLVAEMVGNDTFDGFAFVDLCAEVGRGKAELEDFCREVTRREWQLLFDYCYARA